MWSSSSSVLHHTVSARAQNRQTKHWPFCIFHFFSFFFCSHCRGQGVFSWLQTATTPRDATTTYSANDDVFNIYLF